MQRDYPTIPMQAIADLDPESHTRYAGIRWSDGVTVPNRFGNVPHLCTNPDCGAAVDADHVPLSRFEGRPFPPGDWNRR